MAAALSESATLFVAGAAFVLIFAVVALPTVYAICTTSGRSHSAMAHEVTSDSTENRTLTCLVRPRCDVCKRTDGYRLARLAANFGSEMLVGGFACPPVGELRLAR